MKRLKGAATLVTQHVEADLEQRAFKAALAVDDSLQGRLAHGKLNAFNTSNIAYRLLCIHVSENWKLVIMIANFVHCSLLFAGEPLRTISTTEVSENMSILLVIECACLATYAADVFMKAYYMTFEGFMSKEWNRVHVYVTCVLAFDWILAVVFGRYRVFRLVRPMFWVVRAREPRRVFSHVADIMKPLASVLLSAIAMIVLFALVAVPLFAGTSVGEGHFTNFESAVTSLLVLATMDNYHQLVENAPASTLPFFVCFILLGAIFLMSVTLDIVIKFYSAAEGDKLKDELNKELQGLTKAFSILDKHNEGLIGFREFRALMAHLRPDVTTLFRMELLYELIATRCDPDDPSGKLRIDVFDFFSMRDILGVNVHSQKAKRSPASLFARRITGSRVWAPMMTAITIANLFVLIFVASTDLWDSAANLVHFVLIVLVMGFDMGLSYLDNSILFVTKRGNLVGVVVAAQNLVIRTIALFVWFGFVSFEWLPEERVWWAVAVSDAVTGFLITRKVELVAEWMWKFFGMAKMLVDLSSFVFMNLYFITVVTIELGLHDSPVTAMLVAFRVLMGSDWSSAMYEGMQVYGNCMVVVYVSFYVLLQMVCFNLVVALVMEFESNASSDDSETSKVFEHPSEGDLEVMIQIQNRLDWRRITGSQSQDKTGSNTIKVCQKYHKQVDLKKLAEQREEEQRRWKEIAAENQEAPEPLVRQASSEARRASIVQELRDSSFGTKIGSGAPPSELRLSRSGSAMLNMGKSQNLADVVGALGVMMASGQLKLEAQDDQGDLHTTDIHNHNLAQDGADTKEKSDASLTRDETNTASRASPMTDAKTSATHGDTKSKWGGLRLRVKQEQVDEGAAGTTATPPPPPAGVGADEKCEIKKEQ
eukprot:c9633_g1_i2.p1 GENE.c9633_g1_i2~~c9633_g1_i2.p1  ORF type:complete len:880 (-),score=222.68 c9633_g1_i2:12-2651(-)